jgi:hypothetical protein
VRENRCGPGVSLTIQASFFVILQESSFMRILYSAMAASAVACLLAVGVVLGGTTVIQQNSRPTPSGTETPQDALFGRVEYGQR